MVRTAPLSCRPRHSAAQNLDFTSSRVAFLASHCRQVGPSRCARMNIVWQQIYSATTGSSTEHSDDTRRQCQACRKREKECDSTPVSCLRCRHDDIECPGYAVSLNKSWSMRTNGHRNERTGIKSSGSSPASLQLVPSTTQQTMDWVNVLDSIQYYNANIVPYAKPAHLPYRRQPIETKYWDFMPAVLHWLWVVNVRAMQAGRNDTDPLSNQDLVSYRGRSLKQLQHMMKDVPEAVRDPFGVALYSILFMMGAEMQMPDSKWSVHLEAGRRVIGLKGGLIKCFEFFPQATHMPLLSFMMADIVTATTCPSRLFGSAFIQTQREASEVLPKLEQELIASAYSFPVPLLLGIVRANILRARSNFPQANGISPEDPDVTFCTILEALKAFDAERWASRVAAFGRPRPETAKNAVPASSIICFASLARCYQSAVMLYLILSTSPGLGLEDPQWRQTIHSARYTLTQHLRLLFKQGHNGADNECDGPLHTQLWKFVGWPILVSIYVRAAWGERHLAVDSPLGTLAAMDYDDDMDKDMQHMRALSAGMGSRKFLHIEKLASMLQRSRAAVVEKGIRPTWSWDDGFNDRTAFVV